MSEETTIKPCPICGKVPRRSDASLYCPSCGFLALEAWWNRLSDAVALARAVGVLGQGVDRVEFRQWIEGWGSRAWSVREEIAGPKGPRTLAAALIALAEQVTE